MRKSHGSPSSSLRDQGAVFLKRIAGWDSQTVHRSPTTFHNQVYGRTRQHLTSSENTNRFTREYCLKRPLKTSANFKTTSKNNRRYSFDSHFKKTLTTSICRASSKPVNSPGPLNRYFQSVTFTVLLFTALMLLVCTVDAISSTTTPPSPTPSSTTWQPVDTSRSGLEKRPIQRGRWFGDRRQGVAFNLESGQADAFCKRLLTDTLNDKGSSEHLILLHSVACRRSYSLFSLVPPAELTRASTTLQSCLGMFAKLTLMENDTFTSIGSFLSLLNRLSCKPKFQYILWSNATHENITSTGSLHEDAYSLCSTCTECKLAYREWACAFNFPFHNGFASPGDWDRLKLRCDQVTRWCPLLVPMDVHSGQPFFLCSEGYNLGRRLIRSRFCDSNKTNASMCFLPYVRHPLQDSANSSTLLQEEPLVFDLNRTSSATGWRQGSLSLFLIANVLTACLWLHDHPLLAPEALFKRPQSREASIGEPGKIVLMYRSFT